MILRFWAVPKHFAVSLHDVEETWWLATIAVEWKGPFGLTGIWPWVSWNGHFHSFTRTFMCCREPYNREKDRASACRKCWELFILFSFLEMGFVQVSLGVSGIRDIRIPNCQIFLGNMIIKHHKPTINEHENRWLLGWWFQPDLVPGPALA